jgi:glucose/arabinose dehydrogenase
MCSPHAGRIFRSDAPENEEIPLCHDYCVETYIKCRFSLLRMFKLHPWRQGLVSKFPNSNEVLERDAAAFCERYASDPPYCYPDVTSLEGQFVAAPPPPPEQTGCVCLVPVASGLRQPLTIVGAGDGSDRLFVVEMTGTVRILEERRALPNGPKVSVFHEEPFLNITSLLMAHKGDDGLLNIVFHPQFRQNGRLFIYYTYRLVKDFNNTTADLFSMNITEFRIARDNPNKVDYDSERPIFSVLYLSLAENIPELTGGGFFFKDGYLYLGIGEREVIEGDGVLSRNLSSYRGKILRFDVDNPDEGRGYAVPPDNPYIDDPSALPEIYASGIRMPWRCSADLGDPETGDGAGRVFCPDVGSKIAEEVNIVEKGGDYGYPTFEGYVCRADNQTCDEDRPNIVFPIDAYEYGSEGIAVIGGHMYRGCLHPNLNGVYIYGDFTGGLLALRENKTSGEWQRQKLCVGDSQVCPGASTLPPFVQAFGQDDGGEVYLLGTSIPSYAPGVPATGVIYQITDPARRNDPRKCWRSWKFTPTASSII